MRVAFIGDTHCGHLLGLTPPEYQRQGWDLHYAVSDLWQWYTEQTKDNIDVAVWMGDLVDGPGRRGNNNHLTTDMETQSDMAIEIVRTANANKNVFVYGTPYHVTGAMDYEAIVAREFGGDIRTHQKIEVDGYRYDVSHAVGKTGTPVGGDIMITKKRLWSHINDVMAGRNPAHYVIRAHVHEYRITGNSVSTGITCPCLKFGLPDYEDYARKLDGYYDMGLLIHNTGSDTWEKRLFPWRIQYTDDYRSVS